MNSMAANDVISKYSELGMDMGSDFRDEVEAYADSFGTGAADDHRLQRAQGTAAEPVDRVFRCRQRLLHLPG